MAREEYVLVKFYDEEIPMNTWVSIGVPYSEDIDDGRIFYYFEDEEEFERAKLESEEFEFQILDR